MHKNKLVKIILIFLCTYIEASFQIVIENFSEKDLLNYFKNYHNTLLNKELYPFLNDCYGPNCCSEEFALCPIYFEMLYRIKEKNITVNNGILLNITESSDFCNSFNSKIPEEEKYVKLKHTASDFRSKKLCETLCLNVTLLFENNFEIKPICKLIAWSHDILNPEQKTKLLKFKENSTKRTTIAISRKLNNQSNNTVIENIKSLNDDHIELTKLKTDEIGSKFPKTGNITFQSPVDTNSNHTDFKRTNSIGKQSLTASENIQVEISQLTPDAYNFITTLKIDESTIDKNTNDKDNIANENGCREEMCKDNLQRDGGYNEEDESSSYQVVTQEVSNAFEPTNLFDSETKASSVKEVVPISDPFFEETGSNFFTYFLIGTLIVVFFYVACHSKPKILALILEGRRSQNLRNGKRKHTAAYRKLDSNLEEAMTSTVNCRTSQIIY